MFAIPQNRPLLVYGRRSHCLAVDAAVRSFSPTSREGTPLLTRVSGDFRLGRRHELRNRIRLTHWTAPRAPIVSNHPARGEIWARLIHRPTNRRDDAPRAILIA